MEDNWLWLDRHPGGRGLAVVALLTLHHGFGIIGTDEQVVGSEGGRGRDRDSDRARGLRRLCQAGDGAAALQARISTAPGGIGREIVAGHRGLGRCGAGISRRIRYGKSAATLCGCWRVRHRYRRQIGQIGCARRDGHCETSLASTAWRK
jgi:hypothetical protein